jgi:phosphoribosylformylglycinamidine synthase
VDLAAEKALAELLAEGVGLLTSAHDLSDGGLAQALVESCLRRGTGVSVALTGDSFVDLFSESGARVLVTVAAEDGDRLVELASRHGVPLARLGATGGGALVVEGEFEIPLEELREAWTATLPAALG